MSAALYEISWQGYPNDPKPEIHGIEYFDTDMGFEKEEAADIAALSPGEQLTIGGPFDSVTVVRKQ